MNETVDRIQGYEAHVAFKAPVVAKTTGDISLSGEQTIDTVSVVSGDRVLVSNQSSSEENGIYVVSTGNWQRATDLNSQRDFVKGTRVFVNGGSAGNKDSVWRIDYTNKPTIGSDALNFIEATGGKSFAELAEDWANLTGSDVDNTGEYSAKEYAQGDVETSGGSAKAWAQDDSAPDGGSAKSAKTWASEAADSAQTAESALAGTTWRDVKWLTNADTPYSVPESEGGFIYMVDTSGGDVDINLPEIANIDTPFTVGVKKNTTDTNNVNINAGGSEEIGESGKTQHVLQSTGGATLIADNDKDPNRWGLALFGRSEKNTDEPAGIGGYYAVQTDLTGSERPDSDKYIELTAGLTGAGQYNEGKLINETVSGSQPTLDATAEISDPESPMNGQTVRLINTEERYLQPGESAGTTAQDQMERIQGDFETFDAATDNAPLKDGNNSVSGAFETGGSHAASTAESGDSGRGLAFDSANVTRTGDHTDVKNIQTTYFMRIK